jgi:hypothetical protein
MAWNNKCAPIVNLGNIVQIFINQYLLLFISMIFTNAIKGVGDNFLRVTVVRKNGLQMDQFFLQQISSAAVLKCAQREGVHCSHFLTPCLC